MRSACLLLLPVLVVSVGCMQHWPPLPARFLGEPMSPPARMPLCGNGRVDTEADYRAYYDERPDEWVPLPYGSALMDFRLISARERCDGACPAAHLYLFSFLLDAALR